VELGYAVGSTVGKGLTAAQNNLMTYNANNTYSLGLVSEEKGVSPEQGGVVSAGAKFSVKYSALKEKKW
jgi:hypothetical protein